MQRQRDLGGPRECAGDRAERLVAELANVAIRELPDRPYSDEHKNPRVNRIRITKDAEPVWQRELVHGDTCSVYDLRIQSIQRLRVLQNKHVDRVGQAVLFNYPE